MSDQKIANIINRYMLGAALIIGLAVGYFWGYLNALA
jgi:hypothetical protein